MKTNKYLLYIALITIGFILGWLILPSNETLVNQNENHEEHSENQTYTCSMHPQIQMPEPGQCPICFMDLIPVSTSSESGSLSDSQFSMSEKARIIARIETSMVERREAVKTINLTGKLALDETRTKMITSWIPGRIDKLYADFTGMTVHIDDHVASLYSPDIISAQEELIQALKFMEKSKRSSDSDIINTAERQYQAAVNKLSLLGLKQNQIDEILETGSPSSNIDIKAPLGGVILEKYIHEGKYVKTGEPLFLISDLSHLWLILNAYESDISFLKYGQKVEFQVDAFPGRTFSGQISFVNPIINSDTRTIEIRANVDNPNFLLKPEMFTKAAVSVKISRQDKLIEPDLSGLWVCPMHPEELHKNPGSCSICGMDLVPTQTSVTSNHSEFPLLIPASAVLFTGKRAVVYVELANRDEPTYEGREIVVGSRVGSDYVVLEGLKEGEKIVIKGNFKIDSALQIVAKKSMMNPDGGAPAPNPHAGMDMGGESSSTDMDMDTKSKEKKMLLDSYSQIRLSKLFDVYFKLQQSLSEDDVKAAKKHNAEIYKIADTFDKKRLKKQSDHYEKLLDDILKASKKASKTRKITAIRKEFELLSQSLIHFDEMSGNMTNTNHFKAFCPMAFDNKGSFWLQTDKDIKNPYFGKSMLKCGEIKAEYTSGASHE